MPDSVPSAVFRKSPQLDDASNQRDGSSSASAVSFVMLATTEPREFTLIILYVLPVLIVLLSAVSNTTCSFLVVGGADFANDVNVGIWKIGESGQQCTSYHKSEIGFGAPGFARLVGFLGMLVNILLCYGMWESYRGRYAYRGGKRTLARMAIVASGLNGLQVFGMAVANACITAEKCDMGGGSWGGVFALIAGAAVGLEMLRGAEKDDEDSVVRKAAGGEGYKEVEEGGKEMTEIEKWTMVREGKEDGGKGKGEEVARAEQGWDLL